jgi:hypothetical protein
MYSPEDVNLDLAGTCSDFWECVGANLNSVVSDLDLGSDEELPHEVLYSLFFS